jgi:hypothetical protein
MSNSKLCMPIDVHFLSASFYVYKVKNFVKKHKPANESDLLGSMSGEIFGHESISQAPSVFVFPNPSD